LQSSSEQEITTKSTKKNRPEQLNPFVSFVVQVVAFRTYLKIKIRVPGKTRDGEKAEHTRSM